MQLSYRALSIDSAVARLFELVTLLRGDLAAINYPCNYRRNLRWRTLERATSLFSAGLSCRLIPRPLYSAGTRVRTLGV